MKNQYFGDINDFQKYAILRAFAKTAALQIGVSWMLTPDDGTTDGEQRNYLAQAHRWRAYDPDLFEFLCQITRRDVNLLESNPLIPQAKYYAEILADSIAERKKYFDQMAEHFAEVDLIFFDPDNGLEVPSVKIGQSRSSKYLYYQEAADMFKLGKSLLIYQHFPRIKRDHFIKMTADKIKQITSANDVFALATKSVVYFLVSDLKYSARFYQALQHIQDLWKNQIDVYSFSAPSI